MILGFAGAAEFSVAWVAGRTASSRAARGGIAGRIEAVLMVSGKVRRWAQADNSNGALARLWLTGFAGKRPVRVVGVRGLH